MCRVIKLAALIAVTLTGMALWAQPAAANTKVTTIFHFDDTFVDSQLSQTCGFDITAHFLGPVKVADYYDNSGFHYKSIVTVGAGGPLTFTYTANGTTLTMQNQAFQQVITFNADGSVNTVTDNGPIAKFTVPGSGVVFLVTGKITFDGGGNLVFVAGPHPLNENFDAFCAAFG